MSRLALLQLLRALLVGLASGWLSGQSPAHSMGFAVGIILALQATDVISRDVADGMDRARLHKVADILAKGRKP